MTHGSLFSGAGGFDLAAQWAGWDNVFQVEIDQFCQQILKKNFPDVQRFTDIRTFDGSEFTGKIDIISGGFPCQPFSVAGNRTGRNDDRALWPEMLRVIRTIQPTWIVGENVTGIISMELDQVLSDLEGIGYAAQAFVIPACAVNAIHRRDRVWIVANAQSPIGERPRISRERRPGHSDDHCCNGRTYANADCARREERYLSALPKGQGFGTGPSTSADSDPFSIGREVGRLRTEQVETQPQWSVEANECGNSHWRHCGAPNEIWQPDDTSDLLRAAYGLPGRVDRRNARIKAMGNAIVPQVAYEIFNAINCILLASHTGTQP